MSVRIVQTLSDRNKAWDDALNNETFLDHLDDALLPNGIYEMPRLTVYPNYSRDKYALFYLNGMPGQCSTVFAYSIESWFAEGSEGLEIAMNLANMMQYTKLFVTVKSETHAKWLQDKGFRHITDTFTNRRTSNTIWYMVANVT